MGESLEVMKPNISAKPWQEYAGAAALQANLGTSRVQMAASSRST
jgi:hypothetical protein